MNLWVKISSILLIFLVLLFTFLGEFKISLIFLYSPLFYYGWLKKQKNKIIKYYTRWITILFPLFVIISYLNNISLGLSNFIINIAPQFILVIPLYYYGWKEYITKK